MAKWNCFGTITAGKYLGTVEAENEALAKELAEQLDSSVSLCHQCCHECEDPEVTEVTVFKDEETL